MTVKYSGRVRNWGAATAIAAVIACAPAAWGAAITATWSSGTTGNWNDGGNWSFSSAPTTATFPNNDVNDTFGALIDNGGAGASTANLNANVTIDSLGVSGGDTVNFNNGNSMTLATGTLNNDGAVNLNSTGSTVILNFSGPSAINGTGTITLGSNVNNSIRTLGAGDIITQAAGHTIQGSGSLLINSGGFVNQGQVIANNAGSALTIDPGAGGFDNSGGTLQATAGATMNLNTATYTNTGGTIRADGAGSVVQLNSSAVEIVGGDLTTTAGGEIRTASGGPILDGVTVTNGSNLVQATGADSRIRSGIVNNGTWNLNDAGNDTRITVEGSQTITGTGEIVMSNSFNNVLSVNGFGGEATGDVVVTLDSSQTIRGAGRIQENFGGFVNNGTVRQQGTVEMVLDPGGADAGLGANFVNNGILRTEGAGGLRLNAGIYDNNTSIETVGTGDIRLNSGVTIQGGSLDSSGGAGVIRANGAATLLDLEGVTVTAGTNLVQGNGFDTEIRNGITNNGTWELNATGSSNVISFDGSQTISGTGEIVMSDNFQNVITNSGAGAASNILTLDVGQTIRGAGQIQQNFGGFVNNGTILQQGSTTLQLDPGTADAGGGANFVNNAVLRTEGAGGLLLSIGTYQNNTTIESTGSGNIRLNNGVTLRGGTLDTSAGSGIVEALGGGTSLDLENITVAAGTNLVQGNGNDTEIRNGITNNGTWELNATGSSTVISFDGSQTIAGTGEIVMTDSAQNFFSSSGAGALTSVLTISANQTIRGTGSLLQNSGGMINTGTIDATGATNEIVIDGGTPGFINQGTLRASGAAGLDINGASDQFTQAGGLVDIQSGSRADIISGNYVQTGGQTTVNGIMTTAGFNSTVELQGGRFGGSGTVDFNGAGVHAFNNIGGTMAVGNSPGHLTLTDGDYVQSATASFEFELFGAVAGVSHDLLTILNGDADLSGDIDVIADAGFASTLTIGQTFEVIQLDTGAFTNGFFDNLTVNLVGLDFVQFFGANSLGGTSLFLQVTQADVVVGIAEPNGILIVLSGLVVMGVARRRRMAA